MANFTLRRHDDFVFALEEMPDKTFSIPHMSNLSFEDSNMLQQMQGENDVVKSGMTIKRFLLKFAPELDKLGLQDMQYAEIFQAYTKYVGKSKLGES